MAIDFFKNSQSYLTRTLLILLAITFVVGFGFVGGISIGGRGPSGGTAVQVNGENVPLAQFYNLRDSMYSQYKQQIPNLPDDAINFVTTRALDNIVELKLLSQKARDLGLRISDEELAESIKTNPAFQVDGIFVGAERYTDFITNRLNLSIGEFEKGYKDELLARKLIELINESTKVTNDELLELYKTNNEEINLNFIVFKADDYKNDISPSDDEINKFYDNNKNEFLTDEKRKVRYLRLDTGDFNKNVMVSEQELKAYYDAYNDEFKTDDGNQKAFEEVRDEINNEIKEAKSDAFYNEFIENLNSGKDIDSIDKLAADNGFGEIKESFSFRSNDPATDIPSEVKNKAFTISEGEVTFLQNTDSLWIFQISEIKDQEQKSISEVRDEIVDILKDNNAKDKARLIADETLLKFQNSDKSFIEIAESMNFSVQETGYFTRVSGPEMIENEELIFDSFQVKTENSVLPRVYNSGDEFLIISLKDKKPIDTDDFEQNKFTVKQQELTRLQNEVITSWVDKLRSESKIIPNEKLFQPQG